MWVEGGLAYIVNGRVKGLEVLINHDPINGCVPIIRGCITCRGASRSIGHKPHKLSHP